MLLLFLLILYEAKIWVYNASFKNFCFTNMDLSHVLINNCEGEFPQSEMARYDSLVEWGKGFIYLTLPCIDSLCNMYWLSDYPVKRKVHTWVHITTHTSSLVCIMCVCGNCPSPWNSFRYYSAMALGTFSGTPSVCAPQLMSVPWICMNQFQ